MEELQANMADIKSALASVNAYLAYFQAIIQAEVENKKKKVDKKKKCTHLKERNVYTKNESGQIVLIKDFAMTLTPEQTRYYDSMAKEYPKICMFDEPLKFEEYNRLIQRFGRKYVIATMNELENYKKNDKYISAYKALMTWLGKDVKH